MSEKSIKFGDEKFNESNFYKDEELFKMEDIDINKTLSLKKNRLKKNITLDIMIMMMMSLDHYV